MQICQESVREYARIAGEEDPAAIWIYGVMAGQSGEHTCPLQCVQHRFQSLEAVPHLSEHWDSFWSFSGYDPLEGATESLQ